MLTNTALLIIDMINDFRFSHGSTLSAKTTVIAENIKLLKQQCRKESIPIIYINDHYNLWKADLETIITYCSNEYSKPIIEKVKPTKDDYFLIKPKHSAFYETALHTLLTQLKVKNIILTGIAGNICVLFTANDAYMREYTILVPENSVASVAEEDNQYALRMMENVLDAKIFTYKENTSMTSILFS